MPSSSRSPTFALKRRQTVWLADQFVDVGEALEGGGDVGEHLADDLPALEAAEEDRAVEDDVLASVAVRSSRSLASAARRKGCGSAIAI